MIENEVRFGIFKSHTMEVIAFLTIIKIQIAIRLIYDFEQIMLSLVFNLPPNFLIGSYINQNITILRECLYCRVLSSQQKYCEISNERKY